MPEDDTEKVDATNKTTEKKNSPPTTPPICGNPPQLSGHPTKLICSTPMPFSQKVDIFDEINQLGSPILIRTPTKIYNVQETNAKFKDQGENKAPFKGVESDSRMSKIYSLKNISPYVPFNNLPVVKMVLCPSDDDVEIVFDSKLKGKKAAVKSKKETVGKKSKPQKAVSSPEKSLVNEKVVDKNVGQKFQEKELTDKVEIKNVLATSTTNEVKQKKEKISPELKTQESEFQQLKTAEIKFEENINQNICQIEAEKMSDESQEKNISPEINLQNEDIMGQTKVLSSKKVVNTSFKNRKEISRIPVLKLEQQKLGFSAGNSSGENCRKSPKILELKNRGMLIKTRQNTESVHEATRKSPRNRKPVTQYWIHKNPATSSLLQKNIPIKIGPILAALKLKRVKNPGRKLRRRNICYKKPVTGVHSRKNVLLAATTENFPAKKVPADFVESPEKEDDLINQQENVPLDFEKLSKNVAATVKNPKFVSVTDTKPPEEILASEIQQLEAESSEDDLLCLSEDESEEKLPKEGPKSGQNYQVMTLKRSCNFVESFQHNLSKIGEHNMNTNLEENLKKGPKTDQKYRLSPRRKNANVLKQFPCNSDSDAENSPKTRLGTNFEVNLKIGKAQNANISKKLLKKGQNFQISPRRKNAIVLEQFPCNSDSDAENSPKIRLGTNFEENLKIGKAQNANISKKLLKKGQNFQISPRRKNANVLEQFPRNSDSDAENCPKTHFGTNLEENLKNVELQNVNISKKLPKKIPKSGQNYQVHPRRKNAKFVKQFPRNSDSDAENSPKTGLDTNLEENLKNVEPQHVNTSKKAPKKGPKTDQDYQISPGKKSANSLQKFASNLDSDSENSPETPSKINLKRSVSNVGPEIRNKIMKRSPKTPQNDQVSTRSKSTKIVEKTKLFPRVSDSSSTENTPKSSSKRENLGPQKSLLNHLKIRNSSSTPEDRKRKPEMYSQVNLQKKTKLQFEECFRFKDQALKINIPKYKTLGSGAMCTGGSRENIQCFGIFPRSGEVDDSNSGVSTGLSISNKYFLSGALEINPGSWTEYDRSLGTHMSFLVLEGEAEVGIDSTSKVLRLGDNFFVPEGSAYYVINISNTNRLVLHFSLFKVNV